MTPPAGEPAERIAPPWRGVRRLLAVRLDNLGDVLMTSPALAALRESLPQARLTLLASPSGAAAVPHLPMVDEVLTARVPWMPGGSTPTPAELGTAECELADRLVDGAFDAAVVFTVCTQSALPAALLLRMAGVPLRLACSRENPYGLLTDWVRETDLAVATGMRHEVQRHLDLVGSIGCVTTDTRLRFTLRPADVVRVQARLTAAGIRPGERYAVIHPGATAESRRWPGDRFGQVAHRLAGDPGVPVVLCGEPGEVARVEQSAARLARSDGPSTAPVLSLAGELSLGELAALIAGAGVLVANNSAPAHLAAATGTPVVALYALTNPQHTPWRARSRVLFHDVPCRWCLRSVCPQRHHACLLGVDIDEVVDAARAQLVRAVPPADAGATPWSGLAAAVPPPDLREAAPSPGDAAARPPFAASAAGASAPGPTDDPPAHEGAVRTVPLPAVGLPRASRRPAPGGGRGADPGPLGTAGPWWSPPGPSGPGAPPTGGPWPG